MSGIALRSALSMTSTPERPALFSQRAMASSRMREASWRFPPRISLLVNWSRVSAVPASCSSYFSLRATVGRRGMAGVLALARRLGPELGGTLPTIAPTGRVERAANDVGLHHGPGLHPAAPHQDTEAC